jgi:NAD kinase
MSGSELARLVFVTRKSRLVQLEEAQGTLSQAKFHLTCMGHDIDIYLDEYLELTQALATIFSALPPDQRRVNVNRMDLNSFLFAPDDVVIIVGQDGLVANTAKYIHGQVVIGINPDPSRYDGILCPHTPAALPKLLQACCRDTSHGLRLESRVQVQAQLDDGQRLSALNEVFVGHRSHQSARYQVQTSEGKERQSSSGLICASGTGSTGWAASLARQCHCEFPLPKPEEACLSWFVREPFASRTTGTQLSQGLLSDTQELRVTSEMTEGGVIFADGIETDYLPFNAGRTVTLSIAPARLRLLMPAR